MVLEADMMTPQRRHPPVDVNLLQLKPAGSNWSGTICTKTQLKAALSVKEERKQARASTISIKQTLCI